MTTDPIAELLIERTSSADDLDAVAALEAETFTNPWTRDMLNREIHESDVARLYVVRYAEARVAAFCTCWLVHDELHINTIAVDARFRRRGLAIALMSRIMADCEKAGATRSFLEVRRSNVAAQQLYERLGFTVRAVRKNYYIKPDEDALVLAKTMPTAEC